MKRIIISFMIGLVVGLIVGSVINIFLLFAFSDTYVRTVYSGLKTVYSGLKTIANWIGSWW